MLASLEPRAPRHPVPLRVAYQDSCHLQHAPGIRQAPRQLVQPETAGELGDRKARQVLATGADAVVSGNPGCLLQLVRSMKNLGQELPVLHIIQLLDASICGVQPLPSIATSRNNVS